MKKLLWALLLSALFPAQAWATWSIIAMDRNTGRVVISSATCAAQGPDQLKLLQAIVIPGIGVALGGVREVVVAQPVAVRVVHQRARYAFTVAAHVWHPIRSIWIRPPVTCLWISWSFFSVS